ncbi:hypothetical protein SPRG_09648 [Saprolegnia parasitica CBS 223.65]|uniref:Uncharacterized protein n=1 Tax=Saprolegnia parasitica (strain CBS 223.65) TaxID=695850 RepID=A0A067C6N4_SAPPC|nr:hypothetical protein SPRG_09648 [Saprolegnia parasitica CBS 223.65]KDO24815.1 hypothetical protein SPRG_09648 [Saprolegnia parasitica CBS 223.65]|eukprot:XP_012204463.1 hypothetical protein SPRG_09648 [Saprolegnia parasitica CBS 223.65]
MEKEAALTQHQGGLAEYPSRKPLQKALVVSILVYIGSFAFTWYKVYWDTLISLAFVALGYYAIYDPNSRPMGKAFHLFYIGLMLCILLHTIAFALLVAELVSSQVEAVLNLKLMDSPTGLIIFLIILEVGYMTLTGVAIGLCYRLRCEVDGIVDDPIEYHELL